MAGRSFSKHKTLQCLQEVCIRGSKMVSSFGLLGISLFSLCVL